jgi:hypothetical protein
MMKSITQAVLTSTMGFAWAVISMGERGVERSEAIGITDPQKPFAGLLETAVWRKSCATVRAGELLERFVNWTGLYLGYSDGEVSGLTN